MNDHDLTLRPITGRDELDLFTQLLYTVNEELADDLAGGLRRPEWMWVALVGGRTVARAAWWARAGGETPSSLDIFDIDDNGPDPGRVDIGVRLLRTALAAVVGTDTPPPRYVRYLPSRWRDDPASRRVAEDRMTALERLGARLFVERLRYQWNPGTPIPAPTGRLRFRTVRDAEDLLDLMTLALDGTLDAHDRADLIELTPREVATRQYEGELASYTSPREWWQIATRPDGEPVGFVLPAHNGYNPVIAYIAVLPAHRGNGYVDEILAEGTRILAAQGVPRIRAATDLANVPMAKAFDRAGYVTFECEINMTWS